MNKLIFIFLLISLPIFGQKVGVNTDNPQETLHVNGTVRIDTLPNMPTATKILVADDNNKIGQSTLATVASKYDYTYDTFYSKNQFNNDGAYWHGINASLINYIETVDLPMIQTITIPDGIDYIIEIDYDMPLGINLDIYDIATGYIGVSLYIDNVLNQDASSKVNIPLDVTVDNNGSTNDYASFRCMRVSEHYVIKGSEIADGSDTTMTIQLKGYIEQHAVVTDGTIINYIWGGWVSTYNPNTSNNWNWGRGSLDVRVREQ